MESLFSLEVIVNYIQLKTQADTSVSCLFPCVAFRLLDYPTIAINLLDNIDAREIKSSFANSPEATTMNQLRRLPCFASLHDKQGRFIFSKGKSCLFRCDLQSLKAHLRHTPMYLMLLDTFFDPYKLVGTTVVPLTNLINDISAEMENNEDIDPAPCMKMTHGVFEIKNLMGNEIGFVSFAVRLTSYGNSLLPHIERTTAESLQRQMKLKAKKPKRDNNKKPQKNEPEPMANEKTVAEDQDTPEPNDSFYYIKKPNHQTQQVTTSIPAASEAVNTMVQTMKIDYKDVEVQISCGPDQIEKGNHEVKRNQMKNKLIKPEPEPEEKTEIEQIAPQSVYKITRVQEEPINDEFCPPILYYNSGDPVAKTTTTNTSTVQEILDKKEFLNRRIEYLKSALGNNEETNSESMSDLNCDSELSSMLEWIIPAKASSAAAATSNFDLSQMPLLKCLFDEMNLLKGLIEKKSPAESHQIIRSQHHKKMNESISVTNLSQQRLVEPKYQQEPIKQQQRTQTLRSTQQPPPVGILRTNRKLLDMKKSKSGFKTKEQMVDSVNRLTSGRDRRPAIKPRSQQMEQVYECDEIPVGPFSNNSEAAIGKKKIPLKYRTTRAQELRIAASRRQQQNEQSPGPSVSFSNDQHTTKQTLIRSIKSNIDTLNESLKQNIDESSLYEHSRNLDKVMFETIDSTVRGNNSRTLKQNDTVLSKNLDKVMFETIDSTVRDIRTFKQNDTLMSKNLDKVMFETIDDTVRDSFQTQWSKHNKSQLNQSNYSLLNKVEMDSTNDMTVHNPHVNYEHKYNHYQQHSNTMEDFKEEPEAEEEDNDDDVFYEQKNQQPKTVQFGRTYVLNTSANPTSDESTNKVSGHKLADSQDYSKSDKSHSQSSASHSTQLIQPNNAQQYSEADFHSYESSVTNATNKPTEPSNQYLNDYLENDDSYNEIEYLGMTGGYCDEPDNLLAASKHSSNYNSKSFVTDSLSNTKDSLQSQRSSRSFRH